ncbi:fimbrial protein [Enterobacter asburiae]|uniref:fimbrial protein n=1 Tax=Enterobacter TaxID=547 RepID=UPI0004DB41B1|nr:MULTISPECIES: fimbrial protein [Enterobacter]KFA84180.1 hypothetical protein N037_22185 [Enterobacter sp. EGD-HP1]MEB8258288.1 fimbrial protein [Enterobacter asburiae]
MTGYGKLLLLLAVTGGLTPGVSEAVSNQTGDSVTYKFSGRLQAATPCTISNDQVITVDFGNVAVSRLNGGAYIQPVNYTLECGSAGSANTVSMVFKATPVASDAATFSSTINGLWVKVLKDGQPLELNKAFTVADPLSPPAIEVQLEKDPATDLAEGSFTATGTLMAEYI